MRPEPEVEELVRAAFKQDEEYFAEVKKEIGEDAALCISEISNLIGACRQHPGIGMMLGATVQHLLGHIGTHFKLEEKPTMLIIERFIAIRLLHVRKNPAALN